MRNNKHIERQRPIVPTSINKQNLSGWNAMGNPVPANRLQKGYKTILEILECDRETAMDIARRCAQFILNDECAYIIGDVSLEAFYSRELKFNRNLKATDLSIRSIDLTGRYRVLAEMLTD